MSPKSTSFALIASFLAALLVLKLLPAALAALVTFVCVERVAEGRFWMARQDPLSRFLDRALPSVPDRQRKTVAIAFLALVVATTLIGLSFLAASWFAAHRNGVSSMLEIVTRVAAGLRDHLPPVIASLVPPTMGGLEDAISDFAKEHVNVAAAFGGGLVKAAFHVFLGVVLGAMLAISAETALDPPSDWAREARARFTTFAAAAGDIMLAQLKIAAINAALTGLFLLVALPAFGHHIPFAPVLIAITFLVGLVPVLGNLVSNTLIVGTALSVSFPLAAICLAYLVVLHKLEYFLNAKIMAGQIHSNPWEILCALLVFEAALGLPGLVAAPLVYAYIKTELIGLGVLAGRPSA